MKKKLKYFVTLLWFSYLIVASVLLYSKGFLLTRQVINKISECRQPLEEQFCRHDCALNNTTEKLCLKNDTRVILIIVDALRHDFTVFNNENRAPRPFENKLPIINEILQSFPNSTRLYKFIADPPTTTMQRLKALTTGSLPTFIDAGSNFATSEIDEDNLIDQIKGQKGKVVFMGDDTWTSLYPNRFVRSYPYPSFDVWDLDTVDNGVRKHLFPELKETDWNLLVAHFLGVDHCGHRFGPNHNEMSRKLSEVDEVIRQVVKTMDDKSVLFVIGDHGMTTTGDHGGETSDEVTSAMFVHSKQQFHPLFMPEESVKQVDLVPTLSTILGVPIPYQNLGIVIPSAIPTKTKSVFSLSLWNNAKQIIEYIKTYSQVTGTFEESYLELHLREFEAYQGKLDSLDTEQGLLQFSKDLTQFLVKIRLLCEEVWIQFDAFSINNGLTFLFLSIFFIVIISDGIPLKVLPFAIEGTFVEVCLTVVVLSAIALVQIDYFGLLKGSSYNCLFITNVLSHFMFLLPVFQNWDVISIHWYVRNNIYDIINFVCRIVLICTICGGFSNSFINEEGAVLLFLLVTLVTVSVLGVASFLKSETNSKRKIDTINASSFLKLIVAYVLALLLLRSSVHFWRCRPEQGWCFELPHEVGATKIEATKLQWITSVLSLALFTVLTKVWLKKCGNLNGFSATEIAMKLLPSVIVVCVGGFWVFQRLTGKKAATVRTGNYLALSAYGLSLISMAVVVIKPICVSVIANGDNSLRSIFSLLKTKLNNEESSSDSGGSMPILCGLGTAYSAVFVMLATYFILVIALLLGDRFAVALIIMAAVGAFLLLTTSILRIKKANTIEDLLNVPNLAVLAWILLAQYFFYATGHQPTFSNIAWESAFVGTSSFFSNNYILGTLVIVNTFGSFIVAGLLLPLLVIAPFTVLVMMPSMCGKQKEFFPHCQRGELMLFERDRKTIPALFVVSCKYVAGHAIKVFTSMLAATIHSRHLMVWSVFAPKFIFESIGLFVTLASVLIGYLVFLRIHYKIEQFINKLCKSN